MAYFVVLKTIISQVISLWDCASFFGNPVEFTIKKGEPILAGGEF